MGHQHLPTVNFRRATQKDPVPLHPPFPAPLSPFPPAHTGFPWTGDCHFIDHICLYLSCSLALRKPVLYEHRCLQTRLRSENFHRATANHPNKMATGTAFWPLCPFSVTIATHLNSTQQDQRMKHGNAKVPNSDLWKLGSGDGWGLVSVSATGQLCEVMVTGLGSRPRDSNKDTCTQGLRG